MKLIHWQEPDAYFNLAAEEYVFSHLARDQEMLLLWQNHSAVVVGVHQNTWEEVDRQFVEVNSIQVVRRLTGGGAVYHDLGNLNYSFVVESDGQGYDFKTLVLPVAKALNYLGVPVELSGRNDLTIGGQKISGSAQMIKGNRLLHHGTLLFNSNLDLLTSALRVSADKIQSKGVKSVRSHVTNIQNQYPQVTIEVFIRALMDELNRTNRSISNYLFTGEDRAAIQKLRDEKYSTWTWNYGKSPDYDIKKERRFGGGGICLCMTVQHGAIHSIRIFGDFFGDGEISEIEERLRFVEIHEGAIRKALEKIDIKRFIYGLSTDDFVKMVIS